MEDGKGSVLKRQIVPPANAASGASFTRWELRDFMWIMCLVAE